MKKLFSITLILSLLVIFVHAQKIQPRLYAGLSLPKHSYLPQGEVPKLSRNPGFTAGLDVSLKVSESSNACHLIGLSYNQRGGVRTYKDGRRYETRFNTICLEYGASMDHSNVTIWNIINPGASITASYLLNGEETYSFNGVTATRKLNVGKEAPDDLFQLSIGFKLHLMFNLGDHFDLGLAYQGGFNELDLINKNNLRDKGAYITLGYWIKPRQN